MSETIVVSTETQAAHSNVSPLPTTHDSLKRNKREDPVISFKRILSLRGDVNSDVDDTEEDPNWAPVNSPLQYDLQQ